MLVTHFISSLDTRGGGPSVALEGLTSAQSAQGLDVRVVVTVRSEHDLDRINRMRSGGVPVKTVGPAYGPFANHADLRGVVDAAARESDVLHLHGMWEQIHHEAARAAQRHGKPYLIRPCGMLDPWSLAQSRLKKKLALLWRVRRNLNAAAGLQYTTGAERDLAGPLGLAAHPYVVPNGVPQDMLTHDHPAPSETDATSPPSLIFLSRLHHKKGADLLIRALAALHSRQSSPMAQAHLTFAGPDEGGYRAGMETLIAELGLQEHCTFVGLVEGQSKHDLLAQGDLFCLPSHQENFGIVVVEALACGLPVVISEHVNIYPEIVEAKMGVVTPMDPEGIADAIEAAWHAFPRDQRAAFRPASRSWVRERYSWAAVARQLNEIYTRVSSGDSSLNPTR